MRTTVDVQDASVDDAERVSANAEIHAGAWQETLDELWALEDEYQEQGWDTVETAAGHTNPHAPSDADEPWGIEHIVPDSDAAAIADDSREDGHSGKGREGSRGGHGGQVRNGGQDSNGDQDSNDGQGGGDD